MMALAALLALATGCTIERNGVVHHVVIGFGVVSVGTADVPAKVMKVNAVGLYTTSGPRFKLGAGLLSETSIEVKTNANILLEVR